MIGERIHRKVAKDAKWIFIIVLCVLCDFAVNSPLFACAVCFGDPKSPLTHAALAGVLFMMAMILGVLGSIAGVTFFWIRRARLLQVQSAIRGEKPEVY